ncbi:MAG TPA: hypothetical protein VE890_13320, partial [Thermoguttaceae bacterium]|nr:hypothetical protein [Thermoguttaceae bacterium]
IQARLDYLDAHAYWMHPTFPGRPWDSNNWYVRNEALVNNPGGTLASLASRRVAGMAYTVSEYNHPAPIQYAAEGFPMIAAFGAFQAWDGIFMFAYCHNDDFEPRKVSSYFDVKANTTRLVHMPACAALFLRGDVTAAKQTLLAPLSAEAEIEKLHETLTAHSLNTSQFGLDELAPLRHAVAVDLSAKAKPAAAVAPADADVFVSDTDQIRWDVSQQGAGFFTVNTPQTKLFTGFVRGRTFELGDIRLAIGKTRLDWATISMVAVDGQGFAGQGRILIAATGDMQNKDANLQQLGGNRVTLQRQWGTEPILCEGIPARLTLPVPADRVRLYPLDESGNRREAIPCSSYKGETLLTLDPKHKTVWYEAEILAQ